jgi:uncharacterized membrane protein YkoI
MLPSGFIYRLRVVAFILCLTFLSAGNSTYAKEASSPVTLSEAVALAKKAFGGQVVKTDTENRKSGLAYKIRLVNNGHVREVLVDATSGELLPE